MSTRLEQIKQALINADRAGNTEDARRLAQAYREEEQRTVLQAGEQLQADAARFRAEDEASDGAPTIGSLAMQGLAGEARAFAPSLGAGLRAGGAAYLEEGRERGLLDVAPTPLESALGSSVSGLSAAQRLAQNIAGRFSSPEIEEGLRQQAGESLQTALQIRQEEGQKLQALKQEFVEAGGNEYLADVASAVGGSATSAAPLLGAALTGLATRNPAAALAAQRILAVLPATQAYGAAYAEYRQQYPDASEEEAQAFALRSTAAEYALESWIPAWGALSGTGARQIAGAIATRTAREAGTEAATEGLGILNEVLTAPELAPESVGEAGYRMAVAAGAGGAFAGAINIPATTAEAAGMREAQRITAETNARIQAETEAAVRQAEEDKAFNETLRRQQEASPLPPVQEEMFPEPEPLMRDMLSGELGPAIPRNTAVAPTPELTSLEQTATQARTRADELDAEIDTLVEQKAQIVPTGPKGGYTRAERAQINRFDRQIIDLQTQQRGLRQEATNAEADAVSLRLDLEPEQSGRTPEEIRREYLIEMQGRQFDAAERARLGEMEGQGATPEGTVFQPTKPRIRVQPEPEQGTLPLPKPRVRVGEDFSQQPALGPEGVTGQLNLRPAPEPVPQQSLEPSKPASPYSIESVPDSVFSTFPDMRPADSGLIPIGNFTQQEQDALRAAGLVERGDLENGTHEGVDPERLWPERQRRAAAPRKGVTDAERAAGVEKRASMYDRLAQEQEALGELGDQQKAAEYRAKAAAIRAGRPTARTTSDIAPAPSPAPAPPTKAQTRAQRVQQRKALVDQVDTARTELEQARTRVSEFTARDEAVPEAVMARAEQAEANLRVAEFNLNQFESPAAPRRAQPAPTPQPAPQTPPTEAPRQATVETPAEALVARTVTRQEVDPITGETVEVQAAVVDRNDPKVKELEAFFKKANTPRAEPLDPSEIERMDSLVAQARQPITAENNIIPVEQRRPTDVEQKLAGARTAKEAIQALKEYAEEGSPFRRIMDLVEQSPFLSDTAFRIAQPEDTAPNYMPDYKQRGVHAEKTDGTAEVIVKGSGYRVNGVTTPEVALHEIVHAASVALMKGVDAGLIKDARAVRAVDDVEAIREELEESLKQKETREGLTQAERVNLDYATKNSREFVAQALSSKAMQQGLKKANLFTRLVDAIRRMFGGARSDQRLWERLASASLRVVQEQTRLEPEVRAARSVRIAQAKAQMDAKRRAEVDRAESGDLQTETPEFRRWFGDSKVVDADGQPLVVYHGSRADIAEFRSPSDRGGDKLSQAGIYFTQDAELAGVYGNDGAVYPVYLDIRNPLDLTEAARLGGWKGVVARLIFPRLATRLEQNNVMRDSLTSQSLILPAERARLEAAGYDGVKGANGVWIAFRPEQIKSAIGNRGTFDPADPRIDRAPDALTPRILFHGTTGPAAESILRSGKFSPEGKERAYDYSEFGEGTVYLATEGSTWLDTPPTGTEGFGSADGRRATYPARVGVVISPEANIYRIEDFSDVDFLAQKIGYDGQTSRLLPSLWVDMLLVKRYAQMRLELPQNHPERDGQTDADLRELIERVDRENSESKRLIDLIQKAGIDGLEIAPDGQLDEASFRAAGVRNLPTTGQVAVFNKDILTPIPEAEARRMIDDGAEVDRAPDAVPDETAPAQEGVVLGPRLGRTEPISQWGRFTVPLVGWEVSLQEIGYSLFAEGGGQAAVIQRARELVSGLQNEMKYIALSQTNTMVSWRDQARTQKDRDYRDGLMKKWLEAKDEDTRQGIEKNLPKDVQEKLQAVRTEIDQMSLSIGREIFNATEGRELTDRETAVLDTIKDQIGSYVSRSYQMFTDKGYGKRTVSEYEAGKKLLEKNSKLPESKRLSSDQIAEKAGPGFDRVRIFVDTVAGRISRLPERLEAARREAEAGGFEPHETQIRNDLKEDYAILVGNPTGRSVKEMFDALVDYSDTVMSKGVADQFRGVAESIAYDMLGQTDAKSAQNRYRYLQALRADDTVLRKKENVNRVVRNLWGEVEGGVASSMITLTRMASTLGSLKVLNDIKTNSPELFSKVRVDNKTTQIPADTMRYGALAGMWTDSMTAEGIRGFSEAVTPTNEIVDALAGVHGFVKGMNVVYSPKAWIMDMGGMVSIPLANGNLAFANMKDSLFKKTVKMVGTAFRKDYDAEMARYLRLGLIDPSATAGIRRETTQAKAEDGARRQGAKFWNNVKDTGSMLREAKEFLETSPKVANFHYHLDFYLGSMNPELGKRYENYVENGGPWTEADQANFSRIEEYVADLTNRTNLTFSRVPNFPRKTERWHLSSFAVYMFDTLRVLKNNYGVGYAETMRGLQMMRGGDLVKGQAMAEHGAKRLFGASLAMVATPIIWTTAYMASPKFLGMTGAGLAGAALMRGLAEGEEEDELLEKQAQVAAIASQIPFSTKANSYVLMDVKDDGTVVFIDAGRLDAYDPITGPARAILSGLVELTTEGKTDKLEGAAEMFSGMYFEGGIMSNMAFTALDYLQSKTDGTPFKRIPTAERQAPDVMNSIYETVRSLTGGVVTPEAQRAGFVLTQPAFPSILRNVPAAIEKSEDGVLPMLNALSGGVSSEFNIKATVEAKARQFQTEFRGAQRNELEQIVGRQTTVSDKELAAAYDRVARREMEAVKTMRESVAAFRAWNELRGKPADDGLVDWLRGQSGLSRAQVSAVTQDRFEPLPIDKNFLKEQTESRIRRGTGITTTYRLEGPELTRDRVAKLQRIREQWIKDNLN